MADHSPPESDLAEGRGGPPRTPRWVIAFGIIAIVVVLLTAFILATGLGGPHGPQRHAPSGYAGGHAPLIAAA